MEAARRVLCVTDPFNPLITTFAQSAGILVISHCFHLFLKQFGQPGPVAQILAGIVLGPSLLSRIPKVNRFFIQSSTADYYEVFETIFRTIFMFLIGLEMDIPYMRRNLRKASIIASGGVIVGVLFGIVVSLTLIILSKIRSQLFDFSTIIIIALTNSASPVVFRLATELKFLTSDTGRLAVCASLITEMFCVLWRSVSLAVDPWKNLGTGILFLLMTVTLVGVNKYLASWCNQRIRNQKYVTNTEFLVFLFLLIAASLFIEEYGFNGAISCFMFGLMFPREGKTTRTLLHKLSYATYNFMLPVYFGYIGFQINVSVLGRLKPLITVIVMIIMSIASKIIGTLVACRYLKISTDEGIVLGFLLDLKGNAELQILGKLPMETLKQWEEADVHNMVLTVVVINTVIAGGVVAQILRKKEEYFSHSHTSLELGEHESELRMLACVYGSRNISSKIGLISAFSESLKTPVTAYLMHLVELPRKRTKKNLMYHQLQDGDQYSDEEDYGGNDVVEINDAVDAYTLETKVLIRQKKVVSYFERMYEETGYTSGTLHRNDELLMEMSTHEIEAEIDRAFMQDFFNRYVMSGQAGYVEKYVENGTQTAEALRDIHDTFSLLIVGKGGRGNSPMTTAYCLRRGDDLPGVGTGKGPVPRQISESHALRNEMGEGEKQWEQLIKKKPNSSQNCCQISDFPELFEEPYSVFSREEELAIWKEEHRVMFFCFI
ncbi:hypothetical protein OIU76_003465 [Salix suchowensis]|nr:hypothetical protein OIU76_003465 [Salix suchowensis]